MYIMSGKLYETKVIITVRDKRELIINFFCRYVCTNSVYSQ